MLMIFLLNFWLFAYKMSFFSHLNNFNKGAITEAIWTVNKYYHGYNFGYLIFLTADKTRLIEMRRPGVIVLHVNTHIF